jgi:molybdopterin-guanine dinucleotide biosynthesis protein A
MGRAAFVLVGGASTRMGRDKALLPSGGATLAGHIASLACEAAGNVTLIGPPERYAGLGLPVVPDAVEGCGPLGGLYTALRVTSADWNLIVACDMPRLTADLLKRLFAAAESAGKDCVVPVSARGPEPLCAVYHRRVLAAAESALRQRTKSGKNLMDSAPAQADRLHQKVLKMQDFITRLDTLLWPVSEGPLFENVNTPEDWARAGMAPAPSGSGTGRERLLLSPETAKGPSARGAVVPLKILGRPR